MKGNELAAIAKNAFRKWEANNITVRAAAIAFFTILPLPSLLIIVLGMFSFIYGSSQALDQLIQQVSFVAGPTIAGLARELIGGQANAFAGNISSVITVIFAVVGAVGAFAVLQDTLNSIWEIKLEGHRGLHQRMQERIIPFLVISSATFIVVAWTAVTNGLFGSIFSLFRNQASLFLDGVQIVFSFLLSALLFAIIYRQIPDTKIDWLEVAPAAIIAGFFSTIINYLFGFYIHAFPLTSLAGTAGAVMFLMLWIFVTDEVMLFGAQFSKEYSDKRRLAKDPKIYAPSNSFLDYEER
jgi:membrane protein